MAGIGRLMKRAQDHLLREPRREDRGEYMFMIFAGCFLLLSALFFDEDPPVSPVVSLSALSLIAQGAAESLPLRRRMVAVAVRVVGVLLAVAAGSILLAGLMGAG